VLRDTLQIQSKFKATEIKTIIGGEMLPKAEDDKFKNWDK